MSKKLFTPGPSNVPQFVRVQLAKDVIHHRMNDFQKIFTNVEEKLKIVFNTKSDVLVLTSSGTGAMESAIVNLFSTDEEILVINTGYFGERFIEMGNVYKLKVHHLDYSWGSTYQISDVKAMFNEHPNIKGVFITYHETSTGVLNNIEELGNFIKSTNALLIADCISGMIVHPFEFDKWHVDCALASSQKGFLLPPGLSFVALSSKAIGAMGKSNLPKYYFDYKKYLEYMKKGQTPYTPAISLVLALDMALNNIIEKGIDNIVKEKTFLRKYTEDKLKGIGFTLFLEDEKIKGNVLVPVITKDYNLAKLVDFLDSRYNLSVSTGQGKFSNIMLRVGIISEFKKEDIDELVAKIIEFKTIGEKKDA